MTARIYRYNAERNYENVERNYDAIIDLSTILTLALPSPNEQPEIAICAIPLVPFL
jgi:hypothetical protein